MVTSTRTRIYLVSIFNKFAHMHAMWYSLLLIYLYTWLLLLVAANDVVRDADKRAVALAKKQAQESRNETDSNKISQDLHTTESGDKSAPKPSGDNIVHKPPPVHNKKKVAHAH